MGSTETPPFWHVNVPPEQRTAECPLFLAGLSDKDRSHLATPDSEYRRDAWPEVCAIVAENRLERFRRVPSELRRYREYSWRLAREHGSVMAFILARRLGWEAPVTAAGRPFERADDIKVLRNDWPYGIDERIVHLVVWTKFALDEDPATGDLTATTRAQIDAYVRETFCSRVPPDHVIWFRNWASLKSVHAVEHIHVMLFDPDPGFVAEITNGDVPLSEKTRGGSNIVT